MTHEFIQDKAFIEFPKIARLNRECCVTEKIDGTNAQVHITEDGRVIAGSRNRIVTLSDDNYGFAAWVAKNEEELRKLGPGRHYGEWWGAGIQRRYGLTGADKRFSLFNVRRWSDDSVRPACCGLVPILYTGPFLTNAIVGCIEDLRVNGSRAAPGFMKPEGVIIWHDAARVMFKATLEKDEEPKSFARAS